MSERGRMAVIAGLLVLLVGCADPRLSGLERELAAIRDDPGEVPRMELPEIPAYEPASYDLADHRSPFLPRRVDEATQAPQDSELAPDPDRPKEPLEAHDLSELELVGTLSVGGRPSALVRAPSGQVHRLGIGDRMGHDNGRIVSITDSSLVLVETVLEQNAWVERNQTLTLGE